MSEWSLRRLRLGGYRHAITLRDSPGAGQTRREMPEGWDRAPGGSPGDDQRVIRLHGGDALRFGDLGAWVRWARQNPQAWVEVEGAAASLADADADALVERLVAARPDGVNLILPTVDEARTAALAGRGFDPTRALDAMAALDRRGVAVTVILPVSGATADGLDRVILACAARLGDHVDLVLRRVPTATASRRLPLAGAPPAWEELEPLSRMLDRLPERLPGGARLHMDPSDGYAACMLEPGARRPDVVPTRGALGRAPQHAFGELCARCAWQRQCTFRALPEGGPSRPPSPDQIHPLEHGEAVALQERTEAIDAAHLPRPRLGREVRAQNRLPDVLCVAPWTSMSATEYYLHPVPCALSWVKNAVAVDEAAAALGIPESEMRALAERATEHPLQGTHYCIDNVDLSLHDLWNNPLLRIMRRQMLLGGPTRHCRSMCRTVMGVEDRGADFISRPDHALTPAMIANRDLLLEEMRAGATTLTARPLDLTVGVASHCNITCGFCVGPQGREGELTDARRDEIKTWLPSLMSFGVVGPGEPLMSGNFLALLAYIADGDFAALKVTLTTNGTLLTPAFLERHRRVSWSHVRVSLNAGSEKTHERMTGKRLFARVMENIEALVRLRDGVSGFRLTLSCVLSELIMGDLHNFAGLATSLGTDVVVEPMYGDLGGLSPWGRPEKLRALADELASVASDFQLKNPPLSRAFRAVERLARERLASGVRDVLEHH